MEIIGFQNAVANKEMKKRETKNRKCFNHVIEEEKKKRKTYIRRDIR